MTGLRKVGIFIQEKAGLENSLSQAPEFYMPTFRNTLFHFHR